MGKWNRLSLLRRSVLESLKIVSYNIPSKIKLHIKKETFDFSPCVQVLCFVQHVCSRQSKSRLSLMAPAE